MVVADSISYRKFWRQVKFKVFSFIAISITCFFIIYKWSDSFLYGAAFVFTLFLFYRLVFGGQLRKRKRQVARVFDGEFPLTNDDPLLDLGGANEDWLKGIGYIDIIAQPIWIKVNSTGVVFYYLCRSRVAPFVVSWEKVDRLSVDNSSEQPLARIYISGVSEEIYIPWSDSFNTSVPSLVGFSVDH